MGLPPVPVVKLPPSSGGKKSARPHGPASGSYVAGQLLKGSGKAWAGSYALIEREAKAKLGSTAWAPWLLAQLMFENPNGPRGNVSALTDEAAQDVIQSKGQFADGVTKIVSGATGGALPPLPPALPAGPKPGAPGKAQRGVKTALYNGWATIKDGKLVSSNNPVPPDGTVKINGVPITVSQFQSYWKSIDNIYIAYTGRRGTAKQIANILDHGVNLTYTLPKQLMQSKAFRNSPFWQANIGAYREAWQKTYGNNVKPDYAAIQKAMSLSQSATDFSYGLKYRNDYTKSEVYQSNSAQMLKQYEAIMGKADQNGLDLVHQATLAGWDPDQFATYLRKQPGYNRSPEYQTRLISFLGALGMVTGGEPTLNQAGTQSAELTGGAPPPDKRVPSPGAAPEPIGPLGSLTPGTTGAAPPTTF